ncbi:LSM-domain-containing protein [Anaeromyces robustus]|uniref:LSM2-LSM8 complex subunit LSM8 n=1 Tax=Anaeromyces robustus TaxID=1754192 RepID=A0A1Y1XHS3_9FUNG|nr:LSM-domain-containing protein [Anaeromyces robustus]|eukprot:ORX85242.1 LSM-domain-containing protein [Anaeromyces robustus]
MANLQDYIDQHISVITNDGRVIIGVLKGYDQATNIILEHSVERIFRPTEGVESSELGLHIIRGDNIAVVGQIDVEEDENIDWSLVQANPILPVNYNIK